MNILLLCNYDEKNAQMVLDHIDAFQKYSKHNIYVLSNLGDLPQRLNLDHFDAVILHYSIFCYADFYLSPKARHQLKAFKGLKAIFLQDEYKHVNKTLSYIEAIGFDVIFTCIPEAESNKVYSKKCFPKTTVVTVETGYVPENLLSIEIPPLEERLKDVGYRGRQYPFWLGDLAQEKIEIGEKFIAYNHQTKAGLIIDIASDEASRLYGQDWINFILSTKAQLGTESGSNVFDFDETIENDIRAHLMKKPKASYGEVFEIFLAPHEGNVLYNQISPRVIEAICLKTLLVLYEGTYSGWIEPYQHYIPLKKDWSNFSEVVAFIKNPQKAQKIVDAAYEHLVVSGQYTYAKFIEDKVDATLNMLFKAQKSQKNAYESQKNFIENLVPPKNSIGWILTRIVHFIFSGASFFLKAITYCSGFFLTKILRRDLVSHEGLLKKIYDVFYFILMFTHIAFCSLRMAIDDALDQKTRKYAFPQIFKIKSFIGRIVFIDYLTLTTHYPFVRTLQIKQRLQKMILGFRK